jgi:hypothetical protein
MSGFLHLLSRKPSVAVTVVAKARGEHHDTSLDSSDDDDDVYVDPRFKEKELKRLSMESQQSRDRDYGMDYLGDKEIEAGADPGARPDEVGPEQADPEVLSTASTVECEYEEDLNAPVVGDCERYWKHHGKSQAVVIAMAQGLVRVCGEPYQVLYLFDMDKDEVVKSCPQKHLLLPARKHLVDECLRRSTKHKIKPVKKSSKTAELLSWMKLHAVKDRDDLAFIRRECKKIYDLLKDQADELAMVVTEKQSVKNWNTMEPWQRLYHCAAMDGARELDTMEGRGKRKDQIDARNLEAHPPSYYAKVAEYYNSDRVIATYQWPEVADAFAEMKLLDINEMPGGRITADEVKTRLADTRAKLIVVSHRYLELYCNRNS